MKTKIKLPRCKIKGRYTPLWLLRARGRASASKPSGASEGEMLPLPQQMMGCCLEYECREYKQLEQKLADPRAAGDEIVHRLRSALDKNSRQTASPTAQRSAAAIAKISSEALPRLVGIDNTITSFETFIILRIRQARALTETKIKAFYEGYNKVNPRSIVKCEFSDEAKNCYEQKHKACDENRRRALDLLSLNVKAEV